MRTLLLLLVACVLGCAACGGGGSSGSGGVDEVVQYPPGPAVFGHVFLVVEENTDYASVIGNPAMPYLNGLATAYGSATQYYANTHPSIGNYFMLTTGQVVTNNSAWTATISIDNIVRRLIAAGKTWKSYADALPSQGFLDVGVFGTYASRHNPVVYLSDVVNDPVQAQNVVPFTQLASDIASSSLPSFGLIIPDLCHDGHDCPLSTADAWLQANVAPLLAAPQFQQDGLLIVTFDEASGADSTHGGGRIAWVAVSPRSKPSFTSARRFDHASTLRTILRGLGVNAYPGAAATSSDMLEFFNLP